ncbi:shikimate kinase [Aeromicrobium sp. SMF47]|nr:shikimate kinase [Aeromicrobium yanjiei]
MRGPRGRHRRRGDGRARRRRRRRREVRRRLGGGDPAQRRGLPRQPEAPLSPLVVLVGPPAAGKSTVAEALASRLGVGFRDTDADVEARAGVPVSEIFIDQGEAHFRTLEEEAVAAALAEHDGVLALGGGAVLSDATRALLAGHRVVFLDVGLAAGVSRVGMNGNRPLLLGNVRSQMKALMDRRRPLYDEVARFTIVTDDLDPTQVVDQVVRLVEEDR